MGQGLPLDSGRATVACSAHDTARDTGRPERPRRHPGPRKHATGAVPQPIQPHQGHKGTSWPSLHASYLFVSCWHKLQAFSLAQAAVHHRWQYMLAHKGGRTWRVMPAGLSLSPDDEVEPAAKYCFASVPRPAHCGLHSVTQRPPIPKIVSDCDIYRFA